MVGLKRTSRVKAGSGMDIGTRRMGLLTARSTKYLLRLSNPALALHLVLKLNLAARLSSLPFLKLVVVDHVVN
jgi:hypothetical protein